MENFKYFKPMKEINFVSNECGLKETDEYSINLYNSALEKIKKYNLVQDFDINTQKFIENSMTEFLSAKGCSFGQINYVDFGFYTDFAGLTADEVGFLANICYEKEIGEGVLKTNCANFIFTRYSVELATKNGMETCEYLTSCWRDYLKQKYGHEYNKALYGFIYRQQHPKSKQNVTKINFIVNKL